MADQPLADRLDDVIDALVARGDASGALRDQELAPLARIAADLRHYPDRGFTARLRAQLNRRITMTTALESPVAERPVREGFTTVTPYVWVPDRGLADFLVRVFDAVETSVMDNPGHGIHRELRIGDSMLMIGETGDQKPGLSRPTAFHVFVEDADATFARAIAAGGTSMGDPEDRPYGERSGFVRDAYGNHWYIAHRWDRNPSPTRYGRSRRSYTPPTSEATCSSSPLPLAPSRKCVTKQPAGVIRYSRVRIGDAALEFGPAEPMPGAYFLYVADPDAVYEQALAAGATSLSAPADRPTGRIAFVEDPVGNHWYIARPM